MVVFPEPEGADITKMSPRVTFISSPKIREYTDYHAVASEDGAPFVARRAMNLHGCAPASLCPPVLPTAGVPQGAHFLREWGAPPPAATPQEAGGAPVTMDWRTV